MAFQERQSRSAGVQQTWVGDTGATFTCEASAGTRLSALLATISVSPRPHEALRSAVNGFGSSRAQARQDLAESDNSGWITAYTCHHALPGERQLCIHSPPLSPVPEARTGDRSTQEGEGDRFPLHSTSLREKGRWKDRKGRVRAGRRGFFNIAKRNHENFSLKELDPKLSLYSSSCYCPFNTCLFIYSFPPNCTPPGGRASVFISESPVALSPVLSVKTASVVH